MFGDIPILTYLPEALGALTGIAGVVFAYVTKRRLNSGNVETSPAQELWKENQLLREFLRSQINNLATEVIALKASNEAYSKENQTLRHEIAHLREQVENLKSGLAQLGNQTP